MIEFISVFYAVCFIYCFVNYIVNRKATFADGMNDAMRGVSHKSGMGKEYDDGYAHQYQLEQIEGNIYASKNTQ